MPITIAMNGLSMILTTRSFYVRPHSVCQWSSLIGHCKITKFDNIRSSVCVVLVTGPYTI
jgi:hypothetical protein